MVDRSTAMSRIKAEAAKHHADCDCTTCRAAAGDQDAFNQLYKELV